MHCTTSCMHVVGPRHTDPSIIYTHCPIKMNIILHCIMNNKFEMTAIQMSIKSICLIKLRNTIKCIASERSQNIHTYPSGCMCTHVWKYTSQLSPNHSSLFPLLLSAMFPNDASISCSLSLEIAGSSSAFGSTSTTCSTYT